MDIKEKQLTVFIKIIKLSCLIYTPVSFLINLLCSLLTNGHLLNLWANFLLFAISFLISLFFVFKKKYKETSKFFIYQVTIYTAVSFIINSFVFIINDGGMWDIVSITLILIYSTIIAFLMFFLKLKSYLISTLIYYAISLASFLLLTVVIANYDKSNSIMILFGSFTIAYIILSIIFFFIKRSFYKYENEEKEYKRQFD